MAHNGMVRISHSGIAYRNKPLRKSGAVLLHSAKPRYPRGVELRIVVKALMNRAYIPSRREFVSFRLPIRFEMVGRHGAGMSFAGKSVHNLILLTRTHLINT